MAKDGYRLNIYYPQEDKKIFDFAKKETGNVSALVCDLVREWVAKHRSEKIGYQWVTLPLGPKKAEMTLRFQGRLLGENKQCEVYLRPSGKEQRFLLYDRKKRIYTTFAEFFDMGLGEELLLSVRKSLGKNFMVEL